MRRLALLASLAVAPAGCAEPPALGDATGEVIGGTRTPDGMFPTVGALVYSFDGLEAAGCTGTLIAPDAVLTAAHCLDPEVTGGPLPIGFSLKHDTTVSVDPFVPVAGSIKHERFDVRAGGRGLDDFYDIGIVHLAEPVTGVAPTPLPRPGDARELVLGVRTVDIVGYGQTRDADPGSIGVKFHARAALMALSETEMRVSRGTPEPQNCHGDSGGPALATVGGAHRVVGVVSRSFESGLCDNGSIDTRVDAYLGWIHGEVPAGIPCGSGLASPCDGDGDGSSEVSGGCSTGSGGAGAIVLAFALLVPRRRRR